jgi:hypothetical protein
LDYFKFILGQFGFCIFVLKAFDVIWASNSNA